ncbi:hypothetical protein DL762_003309 [Monosporascus cannonballus]|uniref:Uncharacterized protein n=1 Tax=Monosporascus cannonballus TaxID=155416 RepID=A0ABY0HB11_9PEZI|nr:hypothetical protein DL762_003309 [Monosporascus cannonballus]RYP00747.1 hypothetical protein DL763_000627 [Monosporascus cannonballus]
MDSPPTYTDTPLAVLHTPQFETGETGLFPNINKAAGWADLMNTAVDEHATFHGGMERMKAYLEKERANLQAAELIVILDSFKDAFTTERPINILGIADVAGKKQVNLSFVFNILPVFLLNMDTADFEHGMWHEVFPPFKGAAKWVLTKAVPAWHSGRWRFAACSLEGKAKRLAV